MPQEPKRRERLALSDHTAGAAFLSVYVAVVGAFLAGVEALTLPICFLLATVVALFAWAMVLLGIVESQRGARLRAEREAFELAAELADPEGDR